MSARRARSDDRLTEEKKANREEDHLQGKESTMECVVRFCLEMDLECLQLREQQDPVEKVDILIA